MSDTYDEYDEDEGQGQHSDSEWATLRRAQKAQKKAESEAAEARKQMAFLKAGIDPDDPKTKYFVKGYEGEVTTEAIKAEAVAAGFLTIEEPPVDTEPIDAQSRISNAASGIAETPMETAVAELDKAYANGGTDGMIAHLQGLGVPVNISQ